MSSNRVRSIRPMEPGDIPQVARLVAPMMESQPDGGLPYFLEQALFAQPWADPEIPSLVYSDDGEILGTVAANVRRARFSGRPIRMVCTNFLYAHPNVRDRGVGAQLLRASLSGAQDITVADRATDTVRRLWESFGGRAVDLGCLSFVRIFRPWKLGADRLAKRHESPLVDVLSRASRPIDSVTSRLARSWLEPPAAEEDAEPLTPAQLMENLAKVTDSVRLHPDYDEAYLEWLYAQLDRSAGSGRRWCELVKRNGRPVGWYVCVLRPGGSLRVLQIAATPRETQTVLEQLFHRAWTRGVTAVVGRLEHSLVPALHRIGGPIAYIQTERMLVHARDPDLVDAVLKGDAFLTRLDGEW